LKTALTIFTALVLSVLAGCEGAVSEKELAAEKELAVGEKKLLTVDFQKDQSLRYRFVSRRDIEIDWDPTKKQAKRGREHIDKSSESMNMVVTYTPIEVDPNGLTTIKATCESVKIDRSSRKGQRVKKRDAVQNLSGKSFTFTVSPSGKIEDYSQLDELISEIGKKAFRPDSKRGKIKEPDMITDFIATQWFLWDSVSSREKADEEFSEGQTWKSKLSVPNPMVIRRARDVRTWPNPYAGAGLFQMSGTFGFLRQYKVLDLQGQGEELFNIDTGQIEQYNQNYQMQMDASLPMGISTKPRITVQQKLTMQLLPEKQNSTEAEKQK